jgi:Cu(I)/Ag(I) efflux system membrane fusion protein
MKKKMKNYRFLCIGFFALLTILAACSNPKPVGDAAMLQSNVKYTCPMHPQILEDKPGSCPICGMKLVKKSGQANVEANISLHTVLQPVNSAVISNVEASTAINKEVATTITGEGYLDFDTRTYNNIAARLSGRIEKLYIKYAFQEIRSGQRIFDIYSPDLVTAQQDLIFLNKNSPEELTLIAAARTKLLLLGMTAAQVNQVLKTGKAFYSLPVYSPYSGHVHDMPHTQMAGTAEPERSSDVTSNVPLSIKEGMYVTKGQNLFNVVNPHKLWALIKIDPYALGSLRLHQTVSITLPDYNGKVIEGRVDFIEPTIQDGDKASSIRVYLDNMDHDLKVNSLLKASIQIGSVKGIWLPRTALLDLGVRKVVFLKQGALYRAHQVSSGILNGKEVQITKGLTLRDSVASDAHYLIDSESFIKTQGNE